MTAGRCFFFQKVADSNNAGFIRQDEPAILKKQSVLFIYLFWMNCLIHSFKKLVFAVCDFNTHTLKSTFQGAWGIFTLKEKFAQK